MDSVKTTHLLKLGDAKDKANGVENVGLATAVQTRDGVEHGVETFHDCALCIRLPSFRNQWQNMQPV